MDQLEMKSLIKLTSGKAIQHSGIAKVLWRRLVTSVPKSEIIIGGVESIKD
ncbi:MAG: hypothetical protein IKM74_09285 [Bacteroidales bacterium]|nr:hypothetical protein [Bacteroidales bacterium]